MKRIFVALPVIAALGGCAGMPPPTPQMILSDIQIAARVLCGFQPTAVQVQQVVAANNANVTTALDVARLVCGAVVR
jgi:hypothetical protein